MDMTYVPPYIVAETRKAFKRRVYDVLMYMKAVKQTPRTTGSVKIPWDPVGTHKEKPPRIHGA